METSLQVFILPSRNKNNRYIDLLISSLGSTGKIEVFPLQKDTLFEVFRHTLSGRTKGKKNIVHVQWSTVLYGSKFFLKSLGLMLVNASIVCVLKTFFRFKFVWTVHNFYAHDYPHPWIDSLGRFFVRMVADCVVVQEQRIFAEYKRLYPKKRIEYVPHANFVDAFGPHMSRNIDLRKQLGFSESDTVLASFGAIAPYKLNEKIIDAYAVACAAKPDLKLFISGKGNEVYVKKLSERAATVPGVLIRNQFIPDAELSKFLSIADYSIFYYDQSEMTSGGIILSLSYGVPVITRNIPAAEIVDSKNGFVFETDGELVEILSRLAESHTAFSSRDIMENIKSQTWQKTAERLLAIYNKV